MDKVNWSAWHWKDHKDLRNGASLEGVIEHVLWCHLHRALFLKADIIGIFESHGVGRELAEQIVSKLVEMGDLRPVGQGFWRYAPEGGEG